MEGPRIRGRDETAGIDRCDVVVVDAERVRDVRGRLASPDESVAIAGVFSVLADPSRCRLVMALIAAGELCVCDLAATLGMTESNVSHHLRLLRDKGIVKGRRDGKMVFYSPDDEHVRRLLHLTREHLRHGEDAP